MIGAGVAAATAWASILLARVVPFERVLSLQGLRLVGGACLVQVGLLVLGAPVGAWGWLLPLAALGVALVRDRRERPTPA